MNAIPKRSALTRVPTIVESQPWLKQSARQELRRQQFDLLFYNALEDLVTLFDPDEPFGAYTVTSEQTTLSAQ